MNNFLGLIISLFIVLFKYDKYIKSCGSGDNIISRSTFEFNK